MAGLIRRGLPVNEHGRLDLTPRKHHGWTGFIMVLGFLLPPLAVAARFGIGSDFFINCILTICGYFPGHGHNFFIQNIRNNENKKRTPKWAVKYGLVDDSDAKRLKRNRQWANRFEERSGTRVFYDDNGNVFTEQDPRAARPKRNNRPGAERYLGDMDDASFKGGKRSKRGKSGAGSLGGSSSSLSRISSKSSVISPGDGRDPYAAERRAANGSSSSNNNSRRRGPQLGDEFLNRDPDDKDDLDSLGGTGATAGRDPYAAERQRTNGGARYALDNAPQAPPKKKGLFGLGGGGGRSHKGRRGADDLDLDEGPLDPNDPYAAERRAAARAGRGSSPGRSRAQPPRGQRLRDPLDDEDEFGYERGGTGSGSGSGSGYGYGYGRRASTDDSSGNGSARRNGGRQLGDEFLD